MTAITHVPRSAAAVAMREAIARGTRHAVVDLSYAEGWSACSCGLRIDADESIRYRVERQERQAMLMNAHIRHGNDRR